jgi:hypothetical protein
LLLLRCCPCRVLVEVTEVLHKAIQTLHAKAEVSRGFMV